MDAEPMKLWLVRQERPARNWHAVAWAVQARTQEEAIDLVLADRTVLPYMYPAPEDARAFLRSMEWEEVPRHASRLVLVAADVF